MANRVILVGNVGQDAKRFGPVVGISLATSAGRDKTDWHDIKCFGKTAEICADVRKGAKLYVEGRLSYSEYEKDGKKIRRAEVLADRVEFLSAKPAAREEQSAQDDDSIPF
jgi:single-strand DNA-binding protein